jgi:hypothetical protein
MLSVMQHHESWFRINACVISFLSLIVMIWAFLEDQKFSPRELVAMIVAFYSFFANAVALHKTLDSTKN